MATSVARSNRGAGDPDETAKGVRPVLVVGVSGATWTILEPMLKSGELPNLAALRDAGSCGVLRSVKPGDDRHFRPHTAWPSVSTGRIPENHGITRYYHTAKDMTAPAIWDHFGKQGLRCGMYGLPMTWPPFPVNGFVIPSPYGRDSATWPPEYASIKALHRHYQNRKTEVTRLSGAAEALRLLPFLFGQGRNASLLGSMATTALKLPKTRPVELRNLELRKAKLDLDVAVFSSLYRRVQPHLAIFVTFLVDTMSHRSWRYYEPHLFSDSPPQSVCLMKSALPDSYRHFDRRLGDLLRLAPPGVTVAVVSEHGMAAESESREVGKWKYAIRGQRVKDLAGLDGEVSAIPLARWIAFRRPGKGVLSEEEHQKLGGITVRETGLPLFSTHHHSPDEVVIKLNLEREHYDRFADRLLDLEVVFASETTVRLGEILKRVGPRRSAMHAEDGIFFIKGPGIRAGSRVDGARIVDVMPTLLRAAGLPPAAGLDGVTLDVFED